MKSQLHDMIQYYDSCETDYRRFWDLDHSLAMHSGFWDRQTKTLADALMRENTVLAEIAEIKKQHYVLDAGCGIGGSSFYLAEHYGCRVMGITLSGKQVETARALAKKKGMEPLVHFEEMDFCQTSFPDAAFDVVWAIESVCHAQDKSLFVNEAYRILKKGGRLVIADGFATKKNYTDSEAKKMLKWLRGWGVEQLETQKDFMEHLTSRGFSSVAYRQMTESVIPSSKRLYWISFPAVVFSILGEWMGMRKKIQTANIQAAFHQYPALKKGLWEYGVFSAFKV